MQSILSIIARRSHSFAGAESAVGPTTSVAAAAAMRRSRVSEESSREVEATVHHNFWMRDPKSGNWIPENHFGDVDAADLRAKLLSKK